MYVEGNNCITAERREMAFERRIKKRKKNRGREGREKLNFREENSVIGKREIEKKTMRDKQRKKVIKLE